MNIKLSILVLTVPSRIQVFFPKIMLELQKQTKNYEDIEIIALYDNKKRSIGKKRDNIMRLAQGEYMVFIDDDDRIASDYIDSIMKALYENPNTDCVVFDSICCVNGGYEKLCKYGIEFEYGDINDGREWRGKPAHTMVYKTSIAHSHYFEDMGSGEDVNWVMRACQDIKEQTRIDKVLYYYDANYTTTSETTNLSDEVINFNIKLMLQEELEIRSEEKQEEGIKYDNDNPTKQQNVKTLNKSVSNKEEKKYIGFSKEEIIEKEKINQGSLYAFCDNIFGTHTDVIINIVKTTNCRKYLELGVFEGYSISSIANIVDRAVGVDIFDKVVNKNFEFIQTTTDLFFNRNKAIFDIIFIDADHKYTSVKRDFENSLKVLNKHGIIIIHDTDPMYEYLKNKGYCNDSYRIVDYIEEHHPELNYVNLPISEAGLLIINRKADMRCSAKSNT